MSDLDDVTNVLSSNVSEVPSANINIDDALTPPPCKFYYLTYQYLHV